MNTHIDALKSKIQDKYVIGIIVAVTIISFLAGMEYKAYQFRSVMRDAFSGIQNAFNPLGSTVSTKKEEKPEVKIQKWGSHSFDNGVKLSIDSVQNIGKTLDRGYTTDTAKNTFYQVIVTGENTGKAPAFKSFSDAKLVLSDGTMYNKSDTVQLQGKKEWFGGCVQCDMNPSDKSIEAIMFDINVPSIDGTRLVIDGVSFDL